MAEGGAVIAGFDAGQTHTTCRLADAATGQVLAEAEGPGVCHLAAPDGPEWFDRALRHSLRQAWTGLPQGEPAGRADRPYQERSWGAGELPHRLVAAGIGASGIEVGSTVQAQGLRLAAGALGLKPGRVVVTGDERSALRGAFPDGPGIVVISGTGTIAVGRDANGGEHRCGGWGWLLDGAGSAMDIGRDGLALSLRMADGRIPDSPLRQELWHELGLDPADPQSPQQIKAMVVAPHFGPAGFARLAPSVDRLARSGDPQARAILQESGDALAAMAAGVAKALALDAPMVCGVGGAIEHLPEFRQRFQTALLAVLPTSRLVGPQGDACQGALALAAELLALEVRGAQRIESAER